MNRDAENSASDDALDHVIRGALRVEVDEHELARMEHYWRVQSQRDRWRRNAQRMFSAAAAVALVAGAIMIWSSEQERESAHGIPESSPKIVESAPAKALTEKVAESVESPPSAGRAPTAYEKFVFAARSGIEMHSTPTLASIDEAIEHTALNADADPAETLDSLGPKRADAESQLLRRLPSAPADQRQAILRLLTACGTTRSAPTLLRVARTESLRTESLAALEQIVGIGGLARAVTNSMDPDVRSAIMLRLLNADSQAGLIGYLSLVRNDSTRAEALSVAKNAPVVPIEQLIMLLDHGDDSVRIAAAITLGYVNGPETTRLLINRVTDQPSNSPEAWMALMGCRGDLARDFLDYASRRPQLLGYYNNARVRRTQVIQ